MNKVNKKIIPVPSVELMNSIGVIKAYYEKLEELQQPTLLGKTKLQQLAKKAILILNEIVKEKKAIEYDYAEDLEMIKHLKIKYNS